MQWYDLAPVKDLPYAMITSIPYPAACRQDGFPETSFHLILDEYSEEIVAAVREVPGTEIVGHFLHNCEKRDYFYGSDTSQMKMAIAEFNSKQDIFRKPGVQVIRDPEWKIYLNFLYPDNYIRESMVNKRVIDELANSGTNLKKAMKITHLSRFDNEKRREQFRIFLIEQGFRIESVHRKSDDFFITFSRKDTPNLKTMNEITVRLTFESESRGGEYKGWSVEIND